MMNHDPRRRPQEVCRARGQRHLRTAHDDSSTLRRELVDYRWLERSGGIYPVTDEVPERWPTGEPGRSEARALPQGHLSIMWRFTDEVVLHRIDEQAALWEPSDHVCTVRKVWDGQSADRWVADWPDESAAPLLEVTVAWLLWHVEWGWEQTLRSLDYLPPVARPDHPWSGGIDGVVGAKGR